VYCQIKRAPVDGDLIPYLPLITTSTQIGEIILHCRNLTGKARPNYDQCISWLNALKTRKVGRWQCASPTANVMRNVHVYTQRTSAITRRSNTGQSATEGSSSSSLAEATTTKPALKKKISVTEVKEPSLEPVSIAKQRPSTRNANKSNELYSNAESSQESQEEVGSTKVQLKKRKVVSNISDASKDGRPIVPEPPAAAVAVEPKVKRSKKQAPTQPLPLSPTVKSVGKDNVWSQDIIAECHMDPIDLSEETLAPRTRLSGRAYASSLGIVDGPFSSEVGVPSRIKRAPSAVVKVRVVPPKSGKLSVHDLLGPTDDRKDVVYLAGRGNNCDLLLVGDEKISDR
jgi:hypothetical protein